jgi:hypothetical protein
VTDFGLARRLEVGSALTQTGAIVGTPGYMPRNRLPEKRSSQRRWTSMRWGRSCMRC